MIFCGAHVRKIKSQKILKHYFLEIKHMMCHIKKSLWVNTVSYLSLPNTFYQNFVVQMKF